MTKAKLMQSISDLENAIKMYNNSKKLKDIECRKIFYDNKKLMTYNEINKGRMEKYYNLKSDIENKDINNEYKRIKNENMQLNEEILKTKNDIEEINLYMKLLNKKMIDDIKLCDKMRQELSFYKKHTESLKQKLQIFERHTENIEEVFDEMSKKHI